MSPQMLFAILALLFLASLAVNLWRLRHAPPPPRWPEAGTAVMVVMHPDEIAAFKANYLALPDFPTGRTPWGLPILVSKHVPAETVLLMPSNEPISDPNAEDLRAAYAKITGV